MKNPPELHFICVFRCNFAERRTIITDSLTYNPFPLPAETPSAFRTHVYRQDEVPLTLAGQHLYRPELPLPLVQASYSDSGIVRTSVFKGHQLSVRDNGEPQTIPMPGFWQSAVFLGCIFLIAIVRSAGARRFDQAFRAFGVPRMLGQLIRDGNILRERIAPPLFIIYVAVTGMLFYNVLIRVAETGLPFTGALLYGFVCLAVAAYYFAKIMLVRITGYIFNTQRETADFVLTQYLFAVVPAVLLLAPVMGAVYAPSGIGKILLAISCILYFLVVAYRMIRGFLIGLSSANYPAYYLILYLCTVEILPLLIVIKYLYNRTLI